MEVEKKGKMKERRLMGNHKDKELSGEKEPEEN